MQTRNQILITRKTLYGIVLLGLFFSAFGVGNFSSARAQEATTNTPTPEIQVQETITPEPETQAQGTAALMPLLWTQNHLRNSPLQAESDISAQAVTLGDPGLSYRYVQTFGTTSEPYLVDNAHLNTPNGLFIDASNTLFVTEEKGSRVLAYSPSGALGKR